MPGDVEDIREMGKPPETPRNPKPETREENGKKREETQKPERKMGKRRENGKENPTE